MFRREGARRRAAGAALVGLACLAAAGAPATASGTSEEPPEPPPVRWETWSDEVFKRAREESKGVLLTAVAPWCKQCAVADKEVYSDPAVRYLIDRLWIPVRVDALERPDLDSRYQVALFILSQGSNGYPLTAFLFPTGEAFWADTFIPADDLELRPGMRTLLDRLGTFWKRRFPQAQQNARLVQQAFDTEATRTLDVRLDEVFVSSITDSMVSRRDHEHGGYGPPPRRQNPFAAELILQASRRRGDEGLQRQAVEALRAAVQGALYDWIDGGFHLATLTADWAVPVFGKLLSVNAAYLHALAEAVAATGDERLAEAAGRTIDFILGTLAASPAGFKAGQAAAHPGEDVASYFAWTVEELREALEPEAWSRAVELYGLKERGELVLGRPARFTLKAAPGAGEAARGEGGEEILAELARLRALKSPPPVMEPEYLDSSAMGCSALIRAGTVLGRTDGPSAALAALDRILKEHSLRDGVPHRLDRPKGSPVLMVDQAYLGNALLDAHEYTGEARYLEAAVRVSKTLLDLFDAADGAFYDVVDQGKTAGYLRIRRKRFQDSVEPSPQVLAGRLVERVGRHTGDEALVERAEGAYLWAARRLQRQNMTGSSLALAVMGTLGEPVRIEVNGEGSEERALRRAALMIREPSRFIVRGKAASAAPPGLSICLGQECRDGMDTTEDLEKALAELRENARARSLVSSMKEASSK